MNDNPVCSPLYDLASQKWVDLVYQDFQQVGGEQNTLHKKAVYTYLTSTMHTVTHCRVTLVQGRIKDTGHTVSPCLPVNTEWLKQALPVQQMDSSSNCDSTDL